MEKEINLAKELGIPVLKPEQLENIDKIVEESPRYQKLKELFG